MAASSTDGTPLTSEGSGIGTQTATLEIPLTGRYEVQSVVAEIDATAAAATPELTLLDKSGAVIAKKGQATQIPSGDTGTATWALRLSDDAAQTPAGGLGQIPWAGMISTGITLPADGFAHVIPLNLSTVNFVRPAIATNDPETFALFGDGTGIQILRPGFYKAYAAAEEIGSDVRIYIGIGGGEDGDGNDLLLNSRGIAGGGLISPVSVNLGVGIQCFAAFQVLPGDVEPIVVTLQGSSAAGMVDANSDHSLFVERLGDQLFAMNGFD